MNRAVSVRRSHSQELAWALFLDAQCVPIGTKTSLPCLLLTLYLPRPTVPADVRACSLLLLRGGCLLPAQPEL